MKTEIQDFIECDVLARFTRYVTYGTDADSKSKESPSTPGQLVLLKQLETELREIGLANVYIDAQSYLWATLPASAGVKGEAFGLLAHVDTAPDQSGQNVKPVVHSNYDGGTIRFADDSTITLSPVDSAELANHKGGTIITASGLTLLGSDDKAGVAEIITAMATFKKFPEFRHPEIVVCLTHDEEIGRGVEDLDVTKLPLCCYTLDGSVPGELEYECFDAWRAAIKFRGIGVHPGCAKNKMINAITVASRFVASLPEDQSPERTEKREGFFHVVSISGNNEEAQVEMIIRDFDEQNNQSRMRFLEAQKTYFEARHPKLRIELTFTHQYKNMVKYMEAAPHAIERARQAIKDTGLTPIEHPIRGGTDGSVLCEKGHPTPNIFAGEMMIHSKREWIALSSMRLAVETIMNLGKQYL